MDYLYWASYELQGFPIIPGSLRTLTLETSQLLAVYSGEHAVPFVPRMVGLIAELPRNLEEHEVVVRYDVPQPGHAPPYPYRRAHYFAALPYDRNIVSARSLKAQYVETVELSGLEEGDILCVLATPFHIPHVLGRYRQERPNIEKRGYVIPQEEYGG